MASGQQISKAHRQSSFIGHALSIENQARQATHLRMLKRFINESVVV